MSQLILPSKQSGVVVPPQFRRSSVFIRDFRFPSIALTGESITTNTGSYGVSVLGPSFISSASPQHIAYDDAVVRSALQNKNKLTVLIEFAAISSGASGFIFGNVQLTGSGYNWGIYITSGGLISGYVRNASGVSVNSASAIVRAVNKRYRVQMVYDGSVIKLFINGVLAGQQTQTGNIAVTDYDLAINRWGSSSPIPCAVSFAGVFADVLPDMSAIDADSSGHKARIVYFNAATSETYLTGTNSTQSNISSTGSISQTHVLTGADVAQVNTSTTGAISQTHVLAGSDSTQANTSTTGSISTDNTVALTGSNSDQSNASTQGAISQTHVLAGENSSQTNASSSGSIATDGTAALTGNDTTQQNTSSSAGISQTHVLSGASAYQNNASSTGSITIPGEVLLQSMMGYIVKGKHRDYAVADLDRNYAIAATYRNYTVH